MSICAVAVNGGGATSLQGLKSLPALDALRQSLVKPDAAR
jgi:hypothetical protein